MSLPDRTPPWFPVDAAWWPVVLDLLPRPLDTDAVLLDLRYLANEWRRGAPFPSLTELRQRWGVGRARVETWLADPRWRDPRNGNPTLQALRSSNRAGNRLGGRTTQTSTLENTAAPLSADHPHAGRGTTRVEGATRGEAARDTSTLENVGASLSADHQHAGQRSNLATEVEAPLSTQTSTLENTAAPLSADHQHADQHAMISESALEADKMHANKINKDQKSPTETSLVRLDAAREDLAREKRSAARRIYGAWLAHHEQADDEPDDQRTARLVRCLELTAKAIKGPRGRFLPEHWSQAEHDLVDLVDWFHRSPGASFWQGANKNGPDGTGKAYLGIASVFKLQTLGDRLEDARAWREGGRPVNADLGLAQFTDEGDKAWAHLGKLLLLHGPRLVEQRLHPDPDKATAFRTAIDAIGVDELARATEFESEREHRPAFVRAYCVARRDQASPTRQPRTGASRP